jgi:hypothetical protein
MAKDAGEKKAIQYYVYTLSVQMTFLLLPPRFFFSALLWPAA